MAMNIKMEDSKSPHKHAVVVPYPGQSHITPMLQLSHLLATQGFSITFVNSGHNHKRMMESRHQTVKESDCESQYEKVEFVAVPDELPEHYYNNFEYVPQVYKEANSESFVKKVESVISERPTLTMLICHHFLFWGEEVGQRHGLLDVVFWSTNATVLSLFLHYEGLLQYPHDDPAPIGEVEKIPGVMGAMPLYDRPLFFRSKDNLEHTLRFLHSHREVLEKAKYILVNTSKELEREAMEALGPNAYPIGPLLGDTKVKSSLWREDEECLQWLDQKPHGSVLYVGFGSLANMTSVQIQEICKGLEESNCFFLWAIKPNVMKAGESMSMNGFVDRIKESGKGLIVSWAPQKMVLRHPSVGGFLSHCGWNSTTEALSSGVPIIACPLIAEQTTNAWYLENYWKVGIRLDVGTGLESDIKSEDVKNKVCELIHGEVGVELRRNGKNWRDVFEGVLGHGGSIEKNLVRFIHDSTSASCVEDKSLGEVIDKPLLDKKEVIDKCLIDEK